jgi:Delta3-Delta2-enoyl-CoA isomerase
MSRYLKVAERSGVTILTLARPKQKNAFNLGLYSDLAAALRDLSASSGPNSKSLVLTGEGDYYSSGNDLANFSQLMNPRTMAKSAKKTCYEFVDAFAACKKPMVCAVNGPAIGISVTTMGLCDVRMCVPSATFHTPFRALGQAPEGCSSFMFPRLLGEEMSRKVLDEGHKMTSNEALAYGFVSSIVSRDELLERAVEEASRPDLKRFVACEEGLLEKLRRVNQQEVDVLERAWVSPECFDALSAYLLSRNKTAPAYILKALNKTRWVWDR